MTLDLPNEPTQDEAPDVYETSEPPALTEDNSTIAVSVPLQKVVVSPLSSI